MRKNQIVNMYTVPTGKKHDLLWDISSPLLRLCSYHTSRNVWFTDTCKINSLGGWNVLCIYTRNIKKQYHNIKRNLIIFFHVQRKESSTESNEKDSETKG